MFFNSNFNKFSEFISSLSFHFYLSYNIYHRKECRTSMALFEQTIENKYLSKIKTLKASSSYELNIKIKEQKTKWKLEEEKQKERERLNQLEQKAHNQNKE